MLTRHCVKTGCILEALARTRGAARVAVAVPLALLGGCANTTQIYGAMYEGLKTRESLIHPPELRVAAKPVSYSQYEIERRRLLDEK